MSDRIKIVITEPIDNSLPIDVQGVGMRRKAIDRMKEVAEIDENSVRYREATDQATITVGDGFLSLWQHNLLGAMFTADGKFSREADDTYFGGSRITRDPFVISAVRDPYN